MNLLWEYMNRVKMKIILTIIFLCFSVGVCSVKGDDMLCSQLFVTVNVDIDDTFVNKEIYNGSIADGRNITTMDMSCDNINETGTVLFSYTTSDGNLKLSTSKEFENIHNYANSTNGKNLFITLLFTCDNTNRFAVSINITDTDQHAPQFSSSSLEYKVPMPLMPKTDITVYGESVFASDIDFSNTNILFTIEPDDFSITSTKLQDKEWQAIFSTRKVLTLTEDKTYVLTATDDGIKHRSSTLSLTIEVDSEAGLDSPQFTESTYTFNYTKDENAKLINTGSEINVKTNRPNDAEYSLSGANKDNFELVYDNASLIFTLSPDQSNPLSLVTDSPVVLTLDFKTDFSISAIISITVVKAIPEFTSDYYSGTYYMNNNTIVWQYNLKITNAQSVFLFGDKKDLFDINNSTYEITTKNKLNISDFDENSNIFLTVNAQSESGTAQATVVISTLAAPSDELKFDNAYYEGTYNIEDNGNANVSLNTDIGFVGINDISNISISIDKSYTDFFKIELNSGKWEVIVRKKLNDTIINSNMKLVIPLTATKTGSTTSAMSVLGIKLYNKLTFDSEYYTATYSQDSEKDKDDIKFDNPMTVDGAGTAAVEIVFQGYEQNFEGTCDSNSQCSIAVKENLNSTVLGSNSQLLITMIARTEDEFSIGKSVVLLTLPDNNKTFSFAQLHYSAEYYIEETKGGRAVAKLSNDISFKNADSSDVTITIDAYNNNFKMIYDSSVKLWNLTVSTNLDADVLSNNTELVIQITANRINASDYSRATLVLKLPDKISVAFIKPNFIGEYAIDDSGQATINLIDDSGIEVTDYNIQIELSSYSDYFTFKYDKDNSKANIIASKPLEESILTQYSELKIIMTISKVGVNYGEAALTIKLPTLFFSKEFYNGLYTESDGVANVDLEPIGIDKADISYLDLVLSDYNEYFSVFVSNNQWTINSTKPLSEEIKTNNDNLQITLTANRTNDKTVLAKSSLVINLPDKKSNATVPKFSKFTFSGSYIKMDNKAEVYLDEDITIKQQSGVTISKVYIDNTSYADNFEVKNGNDKNSFGITVKTPLSDEILSSESNLVFTLVAMSTEMINGYATLVIVLPKMEKNSSVTFSDVLYSANYDNDQLKTTIDLATHVDDQQITVILYNDDNLNKYFTSEYSKGTITISASELPKNVTKNNAVISLKVTAIDKSTGDKSSAVVNVKIDDSHGGGGGNSDDGSQPLNKGLLVAVIILACLAIGLIVLAVFYWYFKIRNTKVVDLEETVESKKEFKFIKNETKNRLESLPSTPVRRPTGISLTNQADLLNETDDTNLVNENEKKTDKVVVFNDKIEHINSIGNEEPSSFLKVSERRPTNFNFANPLEEGVFDSSPSKELLDLTIDDDKKKAVSFDENIERMPIESVEEEEDEDTSESKDDDEDVNTEVKSEDLKINDEMPSEILKEIF